MSSLWFIYTTPTLITSMSLCCLYDLYILTYFSNSYVSMASLWFICILPTTLNLMPLWFLHISPTLPTLMSLCHLYDFYIFHLIFQLLCLYVASMIYIYITPTLKTPVSLYNHYDFYLYFTSSYNSYVSMSSLYIYFYILHLQNMSLCHSMVYICFSYS